MQLWTLKCERVARQVPLRIDMQIKGVVTNNDYSEGGYKMGRGESSFIPTKGGGGGAEKVLG